MTKKHALVASLAAIGTVVYTEWRIRHEQKQLLEQADQTVKLLKMVRQQYTDEEFERIVKNFDND